jgi:hypothetical protein
MVCIIGQGTLKEKGKPISTSSIATNKITPASLEIIHKNTGAGGSMDIQTQQTK